VPFQFDLCKSLIDHFAEKLNVDPGYSWSYYEDLTYRISANELRTTMGSDVVVVGGEVEPEVGVEFGEVESALAGARVGEGPGVGEALGERGALLLEGGLGEPAGEVGQLPFGGVEVAVGERPRHGSEGVEFGRRPVERLA